MDIADILVVLDDLRGTDLRAQAAFHLADLFGAAVTGLFVGLLPQIPGYVEARLPEGLTKRRDDELRAAAAAARATFQRYADDSARESSWHESTGMFPDVLERAVGHAHYADLTVVGRESREGSRGRFAEGLVLSSGAPVLLLPDGERIDSVGKRVLVGWNGSREATRALHDSIPLLQSADEVTLLTVRTEATEATETDGILVHLGHHGIEAGLRETHVSGHDVGDVILSRASETEADLIVMGAYGHARVREYALGGATRRVLRGSALPVFMSH